ncbi:Retrovirus-related Pol polyprotein from transposon TNT 1-94 [Sesbania bispinosa]|nr:Retrovirus-related Pol polyprotein from transposon TNT 1-94 [Sesbania bispinosa]
MSVSVFNELNFSDWSEQVQFHLGVLDLDLAIQVEKPAAIVDASSNEEKAHYKFILNSLLYEYNPFQMNYNTMKDKWNVHELHSMLAQEETRLKNQGNHSIHYVNNLGAGKKVVKKHGKGKRPIKIDESSTKILKKYDTCHFCGKYGHF